ncbi:hypothetical protein RIF29_18856 [Crotalaria pallida]|uniref:Uncharacterized protein n=1 Tax=Crotalaria pallida TaxID=3830 RepID=A0AAN9I5Y1_CROPI
MENSKKPNKIREIVRLQQILKKWKKVANTNSNNSVSSSPSTTSGSKGIKFLKRTLSFSDISSSSSSNHDIVPKGFLAVCVGKELKRFTIPTEYLSHQAFEMLLREAEEEFGFQQEGVLRIPCQVSMFEKILKIVQDNKESLNIGSEVTTPTHHHAQLCGPETILHCLRDCKEIRPLWTAHVDRRSWVAFFHANLDEWIHRNVHGGIKGNSSIDWSTMFGVAVWMLWRERNSFVFESKKESIISLQMQVLCYTSHVANSMQKASFQRCLRREVLVRWEPPARGMMKLNVDGSVRQESMLAACGGLLRDESGHFI